MVEQIDDLVRFSDWTKDELVNTLDVSWLHHENGLEGIVYAYPEIQSAVSLREVSDTSLMSTCRTLRVQKQRWIFQGARVDRWQSYCGHARKAEWRSSQQ